MLFSIFQKYGIMGIFNLLCIRVHLQQFCLYSACFKGGLFKNKQSNYSIHGFSSIENEKYH